MSESSDDAAWLFVSTGGKEPEENGDENRVRSLPTSVRMRNGVHLTVAVMRCFVLRFITPFPEGVTVSNDVNLISVLRREDSALRTCSWYD